jgi:hypothetical protein
VKTGPPSTSDSSSLSSDVEIIRRKKVKAKVEMTSDATQLATDITKESASAEAVAEVTETTADAVSLEETAAATTSHRVLKLLAAGTSVVFSVEVASKSEADQLIASGKISQSQLNAALTRRGLPTVTSFVENPSFTEDVEYYTKEKANSFSTGFIVRLVFRVLGMVFVLAIGAYFLYTSVEGHLWVPPGQLG